MAVDAGGLGPDRMDAEAGPPRGLLRRSSLPLKEQPGNTRPVAQGQEAVGAMLGFVRLTWLLFYLYYIGPLLAWPQAIWRPIWARTRTRRARVLALGAPWVVAFAGHIANRSMNDAPQHAYAEWLMSLGKSGMPGMSLALIINHLVGAAMLGALAGPVHVLPIWPNDWLHPWRWRRRRSVSSGDATHGSAAWATPADLRRGLVPRGFRPSIGWMLGRVASAPRGFDGRYRVFGHVLTCAPTGSGKGTGCVIPTLLDYECSIFCLDLKGENYAVTARHRRELGHRVHAIDPFGITGGVSAGFNPIATLDVQSPEVVSDAAVLADMLIVRSTHHVDPHWDESAAHLLAGLMVYVASLPEASERHLGTVRRLLTQPEAQLLALLETLGQDESLAFGLVARAANAFLGKADRERSGVLSTAQRHTAFLDDPRIVATLQGDLDFALMKRTLHETVYLVIPPDKLGAYNRFARLAIGLALKAMIRTPTIGATATAVLFLLDEFAQLGHFTAVEEAISLLRGYGVALWILVQDLSQLEAVYARWRTFLANSTLQAFGTQDQTTARYISEALGQSTVVYSTTSDSASESTPERWDASGSRSSGNSTSEHRHGRPLLAPDEVRRLDSRSVIVLQQGQPPIYLARLDYRKDAEFLGAFDSNPMHGADSISPQMR